MYKIGGRKNANNHYKLSCKWASWFWRKYHGLALPSGPEINVWLLLRRAGILVLLTEWEAESLSPCWWLGCGVVWCSHCLPRTEEGQHPAYFAVLALSWTVLTTSAVIQPSDQVISYLHCIAIPSTLAWDDMTHFPSPLVSFVFSLCFYDLFLTLVLFFQSRQDKNCFMMFLNITRTHKLNVQQTRFTNSHTPLFLCSSALFLRGTTLCSLRRKK